MTLNPKPPNPEPKISSELSAKELWHASPADHARLLHWEQSGLGFGVRGLGFRKNQTLFSRKQKGLYAGASLR